MSYRKFVIVLSDIGNRHRVVKMSGCFDGNSNVTVECKSASSRGVGTLYILGDKITKIKLDRDKTEYKMPISSNGDILCALDEDGVLQVGGTGSVPSFRAVGERIKSWEKALQEENKYAPKTDVKVKVEPKRANAADNNSNTKHSGHEAEYIDIVEDLPPSQEEVREREKTSYRADRYERERQNYTADENRYERERQNYTADENRRETTTDTQNKYRRTESNRETNHNEREITKNDRRYDTDAASKRHVRAARVDSPTENERVSAAADLMTGGVDYTGDNFYFAVKPQLDEMFVCYPEEKTLNATVPNSRWVKVDTSDGYYVVGLIYDLETVLYICYGIPSSFSTLPPPEIADVCVWLPLNPSDREGDGYWLIYQSAVDGKCVR